MIITNETRGSFIQIGPNSRLDITFQYHVNSIQKKCYMYLNIDINDISRFWENKPHVISWNNSYIELNELYAYLQKTLFRSTIKQAIYGNYSLGGCNIILPKELLTIYHMEDYKDANKKLDLNSEENDYVKPYLYSVLEMFMQRFVYSIYSYYKDLIWENISSNNHQACDLSLVKECLLSEIKKYTDGNLVYEVPDFRDDTGHHVFNTGLLNMFHEIHKLSNLDELKLGDHGIYHEDVSSYTGKDFDLIK